MSTNTYNNVKGNKCHKQHKIKHQKSSNNNRQWCGDIIVISFEKKIGSPSSRI